jgi:hypothetical protein
VPISIVGYSPEARVSDSADQDGKVGSREMIMLGAETGAAVRAVGGGDRPPTPIDIFTPMASRFALNALASPTMTT